MSPAIDTNTSVSPGRPPPPSVYMTMIAEQDNLPIVMYTEGGGGRPGDTDVLVSMAGLNVPTFHRWAALAGRIPRIAVNHGYCFAGNAALFGAADLRIATEASCIGMAGPAMIEGGGLGSWKPQDIGPVSVHRENGVVDIVVADEAEATEVAKRVLACVQGLLPDWQAADQSELAALMPTNRRYAFDVRKIIRHLFDLESFIETRPDMGRAIVTGLAPRVEPLRYSRVIVVILVARLMASLPPRRRPFTSWQKDGACPWCL